MPSAARVQWAKFRVSSVVVVATLILGTLLYELFGGIVLSPKTVIYLYIPDASGLSGESPVRVDGIDVGKVSGVSLTGLKDPNRVVRVTLLLFRDRLQGMPADSVAQISTDTLIGDKFVDITGGTSVNRLPAGGELKYKFQPELLKSLDLTEFTRQLRVVDQTLADIENGRSAAGQFYRGEQFYNDFIKRLRTLREAFQGAVSPDSFAGSLISSDALYRQLTATIGNLDKTIAQVQSGQGAAGKMLRDSGQYDQLLSEVKQFRGALNKVGQNDLLQSDAAWVNANRTLATWIQNVDEINRNPALATTSTYENLNGTMLELQHTIRDFQANPRKYLRLKIF